MSLKIFSNQEEENFLTHFIVYKKLQEVQISIEILPFMLNQLLQKLTL